MIETSCLDWRGVDMQPTKEFLVAMHYVHYALWSAKIAKSQKAVIAKSCD